MSAGLKRWKIAVCELHVRDVRTPRTVVTVTALSSDEAKFSALRQVLDDHGLYDHPASDCISCARVTWLEPVEVPA